MQIPGTNVSRSLIWTQLVTKTIMKGILNSGAISIPYIIPLFPHLGAGGFLLILSGLAWFPGGLGWFPGGKLSYQWVSWAPCWAGTPGFRCGNPPAPRCGNSSLYRRRNEGRHGCGIRDYGTHFEKKSGMRFPDWENVATPHVRILRPIRGSLRPYRIGFCEVRV